MQKSQQLETQMSSNGQVDRLNEGLAVQVNILWVTQTMALCDNMAES